MCDYLLIYLYGPMASWGDIAVGEYRPSFAHPSKSAIVGLLAAALGIRREEEERQQSLAASCSFAVRVDAMGVLLRDYHTTQVPPARKGLIHYNRRSELSADVLNTILSSRDYRCDALYTVAITVTGDAPVGIQQLVNKLRNPEFTLYLGRKSCPLAIPLHPQIVKAATLREAFEKTLPAEEFSDIIHDGPAMVYWEGDAPSGIECQQVITRRDQPRSRKRWQFEDRSENFGVLQRGN